MPHLQQDLVECASHLGPHSVAAMRDRKYRDCIAEACAAHPSNVLNAVLHACFYCADNIEVRHEFILFFTNKIRPGLISSNYQGVLVFMNTEDFRNELVVQMLSKLKNFEFRSEGETVNWMRLVVRNIALGILMKRFPLSESVDDLQSNESPDAEAIRAEFTRKWNISWGKLLPRERQLLSVAEDPHTSLVSEANNLGFGDNIDNLYQHVSRARKKFRELLAVY